MGPAVHSLAAVPPARAAVQHHLGPCALAECAAQLVGAYTLAVTTMAWLGTVLTLGSIAVAIVAGGAAAGPIQKMIDAEAAAS